MYKGAAPQQQHVVTATQLGLPSGKAGTGAFALGVMVVDGGKQVSVNASRVDTVATVGGGRGTTTGGNAHCEGCDGVVLEKVPEGVTEFILGVTLRSAVVDGRVFF